MLLASHGAPKSNSSRGPQRSHVNHPLRDETTPRYSKINLKNFLLCVHHCDWTLARFCLAKFFSWQTSMHRPHVGASLALEMNRIPNESCQHLFLAVEVIHDGTVLWSSSKEGLRAWSIPAARLHNIWIHSECKGPPCKGFLQNKPCCAINYVSFCGGKLEQYDNMCGICNVLV